MAKKTKQGKYKTPSTSSLSIYFMRRASFQKTFLSQTACELSYPLLSLFSGEILSLLSTPPEAGEHTGARQNPRSSGPPQCGARGSRWVVSGVLLQGISPMDEDVQPNYSPPSTFTFCLPGGIRKGHPPVTGPTP